MSRLGTWEPQGVEERLDRMESLAAIQQLPVRYALALDSRDMDSLVTLFVPDVRVGRDQAGREALKVWFAETMRAMRTSIHLVANHIVDFDDADHAHGVVYCHDELEWPDRGEWEQGKLQYWDSYVRVDGEWCFARRRFHRWYIADALHPAVGRRRGQRRHRRPLDRAAARLVPDLGALLGREGPGGSAGERGGDRRGDAAAVGLVAHAGADGADDLALGLGVAGPSGRRPPPRPRWRRGRRRRAGSAGRRSARRPLRSRPRPARCARPWRRSPPTRCASSPRP